MKNTRCGLYFPESLLVLLLDQSDRVTGATLSFILFIFTLKPSDGVLKVRDHNYVQTKTVLENKQSTHCVTISYQELHNKLQL